MSFSNERGQYGSRPSVYGTRPYVGAEAPTSGSSKLPLVIGVVGLAAVGLVVFGSRAAAKQQPRLTANPMLPIETMTAYIVQVSLGDTPQGTLEYRTIFAVGMLLFVGTFLLNLVSAWLRERYREEYA